MSTSKKSDLQDALYNFLKQKGVLDDMKNSLRAEIYAALQGPSDSLRGLNEKNNISINVHRQIINELIKEYLELSGYENTTTIFKQEAELKDGINRDLIEAHLKIHPSQDSHATPLLWSLVFTELDLLCFFASSFRVNALWFTSYCALLKKHNRNTLDAQTRKRSKIKFDVTLGRGDLLECSLCFPDIRQRMTHGCKYCECHQYR